MVGVCLALAWLGLCDFSGVLLEWFLRAPTKPGGPAVAGRWKNREATSGY